MLKHIGLVFTTALTLVAVSPCNAATLEEILKVNWNQQSLAELKELIPDQKAAQQFATAVLMAEPHQDPDNIHKLDVDGEVVVDYRLVDLKGDGSVQFVCLLDITDRMRPTILMAVENDHGHLKTAYLTVRGRRFGPRRTSIHHFRDIRHNRRNEVTLSDALEPFAGATAPTAYMEHIYVYQDGKFVQSDREFLDYYKNESLPERRKELNDLLQHSPAPDATPEEREYYRKSVDAKQEEIAALNKLLSKP
jgi:hypothetical protein